ncbi:GDSL-type esterase/lipase family protein [Streptomyces sp. NPDC058664]|uniref:GDSL-type esterase/lipase family protein n=1 Tax=unclassified Streptomyces TaxID=2593676 RepID=UPI003652BF5E
MRNVLILGDSASSSRTPEEHPLAGWGQRLGEFLVETQVKNFSAPGMSTRRFFQECFREVLGEISSDDIVLICFGNIDQFVDSRYHVPIEEYREFLGVYVAEIIGRGGRPALVTPMPRCIFSTTGEIKDVLAEYSLVTRQVATERHVPLVDLAESALRLFSRAGYTRARQYFCWLDAGECDNYPDGTIDSIHLNHFGAGEVSRLVAEGMGSIGIIPASHISGAVFQATVREVPTLAEFCISPRWDDFSPERLRGKAPAASAPLQGAWVSPIVKFYGTADPGTSRVLFFDKKRYVGSARVNEDGQWRWRRAVCWDEGHKQLAIVGEGAGWHSPTASVSFTVIVSIPPPLIEDPPVEVAAETRLVFSGTAHPAAQKILVTEGGRRIGETQIKECGKWEFAYPREWRQGIHSVNFSAVLGWVKSDPASCRIQVRL